MACITLKYKHTNFTFCFSICKLLFMLLTTCTSLEFVKKQKLFTEMKKYIWKSTKILLTVSGGVDSMLLAHLVCSYFLENTLSLDNLFFVHFNHKLRAESDQEQLFVEQYFGDKLMVIEKTSADISEEDLRKWRYKHMDALSKKYYIDYVVTWHHLNDRVESSFLHLLRGADLQGFLSMQYCDEHHLLTRTKVLRPLLSLNKWEILQIVADNTIPFVQDQTNFDPDISKRNRLRNIILPQLFQMAHKHNDTENTFLESMARLYKTLENQYALFQDLDKGGYPLKKIVLSPYWSAERWYQLIQSVGVITEFGMLKTLKRLWVAQNISSKSLSELTWFLIHKKSWHKFLNGVSFFVSHGHIYLIKAPRNFWKNYLDVGTPVVLFHNDFAHIVSHDIVLRYPQWGDVFDGMTWNKYCIKHKIPVFWRKFITVKVKNGKILSFDIFDKL